MSYKVSAALVWAVTALLAAEATISVFDASVEDKCTRRCPLQNQTDDAHFDVGCSSECKIEQCEVGCKLWQRALASSCKTVCNGTQDLLPPKELYCIIGCNDAMNRHFQKIREEMGTPPAPALVADTLTATSLSLEWEGSRFSNISYLVQWRYEELAGAWQYCRNQSWGPHSTVFVDNLHPYTKYRFRIALLLSPHFSEPIVSQPSVVISTLAQGLPTSSPHIVGATADIAASENKGHYMFKNLVANRNYTISVAMRNGEGEGPAALVQVSTPTEPAMTDTQQPVLILGAQHTIIRQYADMIDEPYVIYNTTHLVRGVGVHVSKRLLFVSDSAGFVSRSSLSRLTPPRVILTPLHAHFLPMELTVDWLNDQLYMLGEVKQPNAGPRWQVARCGLDGRGLTIAVAGLFSKPTHIEVDPYNGYLFWVISGPLKGGLYRLDLADISNGVKHDIKPELILEDPDLGAFAIDHTNFRLLVPNHMQNTVLAVSLDGREIIDLRANTQKPMFDNVTSIATANGLFYWTDGEEIFTEEFHPGQNSYFHNGYPDLLDRTFVGVGVDLPSSQPVPIPVNPPTNVQAILGAELAKTTWQVPHLLGGQGKGAWQNWSYELHIRDETRGITIFRKDINTTSHTIQNLRENTEYVLKTAAYTSSGRGPWSSEFRGKTLRIPQDGQYASILWSATEGLLKSDVTGENVETLIHMSSLKEDGEQFQNITDIAWYRDKLYLVMNNTHVEWFNVTSHERGQLGEIDSVGSIAVDWIGRKLYWSNPKQQLITRGNLNGTQQEPLPILTVAKELNVDAVHAYIYWSTGYAVECARLNGQERRTYYPADVFSGKQVMGVTLDVDQRSVYWIVRSSEGSKLFRSPTAERFEPGQEVDLPRVSVLQQPNMQGPLCYFSDHLLWLQDKNAVIGDLDGQNAAVISGMGLSGLNMVAILDPSIQHVFNETFSKEINVLPEPVLLQSIKISGTWNSFKVIWSPVTNINFGKVFYEVKINDLISRRDNPLITTEPQLTYWHSLKPYSKLQVTIKAFTYWGASPQVRTELRSPPSHPSSPTNTRVFVSYVRNPVKDAQEIRATLRWDAPAQPNGIIRDYKVKCWFTTPDEINIICNSSHLDREKLEFTAHDLQRNSTFYFQVQALTDVGSGPFSPIVRANTNIEMPVPKLLLSTFDAVKITDCDKYENQTLLRSTGPVDLAFISHENKLFWLNEVQELRSSDIDGNNRTKILTLNNTGLSIAADWIGRNIYWSEVDGKGLGSTIYRLDLNQAEKGVINPIKVVRRNKYIYSLDVSPYKSTLFWIEVKRNDVGYLMTGKTDGSQIQTFFSKKKIRHRRESLDGESAECNCPENLAVGRAMSVDQTDLARPKVLWVDGWEHHVYSAEADGCRCSVVVNATVNADAGLPPTSITTDQRRVYWANATVGRVYSVVKEENDPHVQRMVKGVTTLDFSGVRSITALGPHLQPFPEPRCLSPINSPMTASLAARTPTSLTLHLPHALRYNDCDDISLASVEYTIYYGQKEDNANECSKQNIHLCKHMTTYNRTPKISGLKAYTSYIFFIGLKNYYSEMEGLNLTIGEATVFKTAAGAPTAPRNVTVEVVDPETLLVQWLPPLELNDDAVWYQVNWRMEGTVLHTRERVVPEEGRQHRLKLSPGQAYHVWVWAHSKHSSFYAESDATLIVMYPEPQYIQLLEITPFSFNISWGPPHNKAIVKWNIQYQEVGARDWMSVPIHESTGQHSYVLKNLLPKTQYRFRLSLVYNDLSSTPYVWPKDGKFTFETLGDCPSSPGIPVIQQVRRDVFQLVWEPSKENGAQIELYSLEGQVQGEKRERREANFTIVEDKNDIPNRDWVVYYNGTDNYWLLSDLSPKLKYIFRVRSKNEYGWSDYSPTSDSFDYTEVAPLINKPDLGIVLGIFIPILVLFFCVVGMCSFVFVFRQREHGKKTLQGTLTSISHGPDVELATLRELPRRGNFVHNTNALYTTSDIPSDEEMALLPHIRRDQITLTKFLGSGAFGEVFEGNARGLINSLGGAETRIAIKTLRKGATDQEKAEFLKEAQLMSNFKHEHILQLLGVCLDNDPNFIIMELMEGGDLLSYLRTSRPLVLTSSALTILDLLSMCVDVARGCRYLEEMHFVHRDLACRNCLVSSDDPATRVVKIGDFGLARDIYKNDYYRKEGEGLLPVRWMAPESLVDGVFTCQSDVWAFGVLTWEILTLGQQPYPARTNQEVLHYVRNGGRLGRPTNCPEELHQLMLKCWTYNPESRPTFKYCLDVLEELKNVTATLPVPAAHIGQYISRTRNGSSWKTDSEAGSRDRIPFLQPTLELGDGSPLRQGSNTIPRTPLAPSEVPRYLELIYDSDTPASDGYEIPRSNSNRSKSESGFNDSDRMRSFSTSSTVSDSSASTSLSSQQAPLVRRIQEVSENTSIMDINVGSPRKTSNMEIRKDSEKDKPSLEHLLPPINRKCNNNHSICVNTLNDKSSIKVVPYTNVTHQPLLEDALMNNVNDSDSGLIRKVIECNNYAQNNQTLCGLK